jgi:transcriptional regulator GlxA family with amidase domain
MIQYLIEKARSRVAPTIRVAIRRDRDSLPAGLAKLAPLLDHIGDNLCGEIHVDQARKAAGIGDNSAPSRLGAHLGCTLTWYAKKLRIRMAMAIFAMRSFPPGRVALAIGIPSYHTFRCAYNEVTGKPLPPFKAARLLEVDFDFQTLDRFQRCKLTRVETQELLSALRWLYLGERTAPLSQRTASGETESCLDPGFYPAASPPLVVSGDPRVLAEWQRAVDEALQQIRQDAAVLPARLLPFFTLMAEGLWDDQFEVGEARRAAGLNDTSVTSQIAFYLGDPMGCYLEKRRTAMATRLLARTSLHIPPIAEAVGMSYYNFLRVYKDRTGECPSNVRDKGSRRADAMGEDVWQRAGLGELPLEELRGLAWELGCAYVEECDEIAETLAGLGALPGVARAERPGLAVRDDVEIGPLRELALLHTGIRKEDREILDKLLREPQRYSGAKAYLTWIARRLEADDEGSAWNQWQDANESLDGLLRLLPDRRELAIRDDPTLRTEAFLWLLIDCVEARRPHEPAESEHFVELALIAAEARHQEEPTAASTAQRDLCRALCANVQRMRNELDDAGASFNALAPRKIDDPWIRGRILTLQASYLEVRGRPIETMAVLAAASSAFKNADDELERCRCAVHRATSWFARGFNPCRLLTACLRRLASFDLPAAAILRETAHVNRLLGALYLSDRLTGEQRALLERWRAECPSNPSPVARINFLQVDGMTAHFRGDATVAMANLTEAAGWFEDKDLLADAAVSYLQLAFAQVKNEPERASAATRQACGYLKATGFRSHSLQLADDVARQPTQEKLRALILVVVGASRRGRRG